MSQGKIGRKMEAENFCTGEFPALQLCNNIFDSTVDPKKCKDMYKGFEMCVKKRVSEMEKVVEKKEQEEGRKS